jgi:5-methylcytosine-specific restriction endonuclease McrA
MIEEAGLLLMAGDRARAAAILREADMPSLLRHFERAQKSTSMLPRSTESLPAQWREPKRKPTASVVRDLFERDGWKCRFCEIRVIETSVRDKLRRELPDAARWGPKNTDQHTGLFIHMASPDHVLPWSHGGSNNLDNLVTACWTCQFARGERSLEDARIIDPRSRPLVRDDWDGLRRILRRRAP